MVNLMRRFQVRNQAHGRVELDPFSIYQSSYEVRTYRLCRRIFMFHHFEEELGVEDYLVSSTDLSYRENHTATYLTSTQKAGYSLGPVNETYIKYTRLPTDFEYSLFPHRWRDSRFDGPRG